MLPYNTRGGDLIGMKAISPLRKFSAKQNSEQAVPVARFVSSSEVVLQRMLKKLGKPEAALLDTKRQRLTSAARLFEKPLFFTKSRPKITKIPG